MIHHPRSHSAGFTLVELSIALAIIGLVIGGVLTGQSLIRAAQLRSIATDFTKYETAVHRFRDKYLAIPGDMVDATQIWGAAGTCPGGIGTGTQTCNGNGDGAIGDLNYDFYETFRLWQHLVNAGMIEGTYTGVPNGGNPRNTFGVNSPGSRIERGGFTIVTQCPGLYGNAAPGTSAGQCWGPQSIAIAAIQFGSITDVTRGATLLSPDEAYGIDQKMDDGLPNLGKVQSGTSTNCFTSTTAPTEYRLNNKNKVCNLTYIAIEGRHGF